MKAVKVAAAIICDSFYKKQKIFATSRGYGEYKGWWEFPGGKVEAGETPRQALAREIEEELDTKVRVGELISTVEYDYPEFHLSKDCFWCEIDLKLKEAKEGRWLTRDELHEPNWLPADFSLIAEIERQMGNPS